LALEFHDADTPGYEDAIEGVPKPLVGQDGFMAVPNGPGLGFELNLDALEAALRRRGLDPKDHLFPPSDQWNNERSWDRLWSQTRQTAARAPG